MTTEVRAGIVGLGLVAGAHLKGYQTHPRARVVAVCDVDAAAAAAFADRHEIGAVYTDFEALLADPQVNTIDICTPPFLHAEMTKKAAAAGKHVHCEKPFCRYIGEGLPAVETARRSNVRLLVGETYVFLSSHMKARDLIDAGEIGRPLQIRQRHGAWIEREEARVYTGPPDRSWRIDPVRSGGGDYPWIFDHAVHFFATAEYLLRDLPVSEVYAVASEDQAALATDKRSAKHDPYELAEVDIPIITWRHEDPACQGVWMRAERLNGKYDFVKGLCTTVVGEHGMIEVLGEGGGNLIWQGEQQHLVLHREGKETRCFRFDEGGDDVWESEISYYGQGHMNQVHHFVDSIIAGTDTRFAGEAGIHAVQCTLAVIRSAREGRPVAIREVDSGYRAYG